MLPVYNKPKGLSDYVADKVANLSKYKKMAEGGEVKAEKGGDEMKSMAAQLILALDKKDPQEVADLITAMFYYADAQPHEEGGEEKEGPGALLINGEI